MTDSRKILIGGPVSVICANPRCRQRIDIFASSKITIDGEEYDLCGRCAAYPLYKLRRLLKGLSK